MPKGKCTELFIEGTRKADKEYTSNDTQDYDTDIEELFILTDDMSIYYSKRMYKKIQLH